MEKEYETRYHAIENTHWWFLSRKDIILRIIKKEKIHKKSKILDVGCAGGSLIRILSQKKYVNVFGIDISPEAIEFCHRSGLKKTFVRDASKTEFNDKTFDFIIASDVLEHCNYDDKAVREWNRILKPSGRVLLFVPAFNSLWSAHDVKNRHYRRYSYPDLRIILKKECFEITMHSFWNFLAFFPKLAMRLSGTTNRKSDELYQLNNTLNHTLFKILQIENKLLVSGMRFPVGVSIFIVAKKKA